VLWKLINVILGLLFRVHEANASAYYLAKKGSSLEPPLLSWPNPSVEEGITHRKCHSNAVCLF